MMLIFFVSLCLAVDVLDIGYPTRVSVNDDKELCVFYVDIPKGAGVMEIFVDVPVLKPVLVYAAPGPVLSRDGRFRVNEDKLSNNKDNVRVRIPNPKPGRWSIGLFANCNDARCNFAFGNSYEVDVTVFATDAQGRTLQTLLPNRKTGLFSVNYDSWTYLMFKLDQPDQIQVRAQRALWDKTLRQGLDVYLRRTEPADLLSGAVRYPDKVSGTKFDGGDIMNKELQAGFYVLGFTPNDIGRTVEFAVLFSRGANEPQDAVRNAPSNYCPTGDASSEQNSYNPCAILGCSSCIRKQGCSWCEGTAADGSKRSGCVFGNICTAAYGSPAPPVITDTKACAPCALGTCGLCRNGKGCKFCRGAFMDIYNDVCVLNCPEDYEDITQTCMAVPVNPGAGGNDGFEKRTHPPTPPPPGAMQEGESPAFFDSAANPMSSVWVPIALMGRLTLH